MNIIGISAYFHDSACCLISDGALVAAAEEERFTRIKHDPSLPVEAFRFCLEQGGLTIPDIDCVAYYEDPGKKLSRQLWMKFPSLPVGGEYIRSLDPARPEREIRELLGYEGPIIYSDHHMSHAASSYYFSGFSKAAIMTVDGVGEWATTTYGQGQGKDITLFDEVRFPDSLGLLYSAITGYLGFEVNEGEYKVMGLAPYGEPLYTEQLRQLINSKQGGQYNLNLKYFDFMRLKRMFSDELIDLLGCPPRVPESDIERFHQDLARSLQVVLEDILLEKANYIHQIVKSENLCMAGGVALNCVANSRILRDGPFKRLFVQPAAGDAGGALGAAALAYVQMSGGSIPEQRLKHVYLGTSYSPSEIAALLGSTPLEAIDLRGREKDLIASTVDRLMEGKIIGWFQGRMEFGPRSLGTRSILADPRDEGMRDRINSLVKMRESFRPFAPAILESKSKDHFDIDHSSPFMLETCQVRSKLGLPSVTHVDGSARLQTVDRASNPRFASLLEEFDRHTGCPILLNTSFNIRGEPIVCTPADALLCFVKSGIDTLVLEDFIIDRHLIPADWPALFKRLHQLRPQAISHLVYTLV
jgi:carbamoyltransferase